MQALTVVTHNFHQENLLDQDVPDGIVWRSGVGVSYSVALRIASDSRNAWASRGVGIFGIGIHGRQDLPGAGAFPASDPARLDRNPRQEFYPMTKSTRSVLFTSARLANLLLDAEQRAGCSAMHCVVWIQRLQ